MTDAMLFEIRLKGTVTICHLSLHEIDYMHPQAHASC